MCAHIPSTSCISTFYVVIMGNERIEIHDVVCNNFVAIVWDVGFHVAREQLYMLSSNTFNSSYWWVDIVLTKDDIRTLVNVFIANPTQADLFPWSCATQRFGTFNTTQTKKWSYHDRHLADQFLLLVMEVFGCLHMFLHNCANAIWSLKGLKKKFIFVLVIFFFNKKTLQKLQTSSILSWAIAIGLTTSWLSPL